MICNSAVFMNGGISYELVIMGKRLQHFSKTKAGQPQGNIWHATLYYRER